MQKNKIFILFILIWILTSCVNNDNSEIIWDNSLNETNISNQNNQNSKDYETNSFDTKGEVLSINDKCTWCNKCVRISPENFSLDYETRKAIVISQKNKYSQNVSNAIQRCPVDAIKLW